MLDIMNKKECTGCSACCSICPSNAISMKEDEEGFIYPNIDKTKCVKCGLCNNICPCINQNTNNNYLKPKVFAAWSLNSNNRKESSSGGVFYELAKYIIDNGGVVVGATFDERMNVVHKCVDNINELSELKGSKYVQSRINETFIIAKKHLNNNKLVLFVGTPCQVAGLYSFLRNKCYTNLYTVDLICHGVPSTKVYKKYLKELEAKYKNRVKRLTFRDKSNGWKRYNVKVTFENNKEYLKCQTEDVYFKTFLSNICLRPSCYECKFSKIPRVADITIGDFWGIGNIKSELDDDKGITELIINSEKR